MSPDTMAKAIDPVCGMEVDTERAVHKAVYKGKVYYFCSSHCKRAFERDPEKYLKLGPQGMPAL
jgi:YHS domain-containing protein